MNNTCAPGERLRHSRMFWVCLGGLAASGFAGLDILTFLFGAGIINIALKSWGGKTLISRTGFSILGSLLWVSVVASSATVGLYLRFSHQTGIWSYVCAFNLFVAFCVLAYELQEDGPIKGESAIK